VTTSALGRCVVLARRAIGTTIARPRDAALRARMAFWVLVISVTARTTSLPRAQRIAAMGAGSRSGARPSWTPDELGAAIDGVLAMELFVFRPSCWKRAMVLQRFLALNGVESRVHFGVRRTAEGGVDGHAWLEHQGRRLLERDAGVYVVTFTLPVEGAAGRERSVR